MKNLEELKQIVTSNRSKKIPVSLSIDKGTKLFDLFQTISEEGSAKNEQVFRQLYNSNDTRPFRVLKYRLREKLLQDAVRIDPAKSLRDQCDVVNQRCWRNLLLAQMLFLNFKRHAAIDTLRQTMQQAKKFQLTAVLVIALRTMRYHAAYAGSTASFEELDKLLKDATKKLSSELLVEELSQRMLLELHHKISPADAFKKKSMGILLRVEKIVERFPTFQNHLNLFRIAVRHYEMMKQHRKVLEWCNRAEHYFDANKHMVQKGRRAEFALYRMYSSFSLSDFSTGEQCAAECENLFKAGSDNWLIFLEYYFLLCMHTGNYTNALKIFYQVSNHPKFKALPAIRIEKWKIYEAYLNFALPDNLPKLKFNVFKFINEVPMYSRDKSGFNLSISIAHILLLINLGKTGDLMQMEESLTAYCNRHLRKGKNHRSYYFMKMILVLLKYNMDYNKSNQIAAKFLVKLMEGIDEEQTSTEEMEIIPYEKLWDLVQVKLVENEMQRKNEEKEINERQIRA